MKKNIINANKKDVMAKKVAKIVNSATSYDDGIAKLDNFCNNKILHGGCSKSGVCTGCAVNGGKDKLAKMFGVTPKCEAPVVVNVNKMTVKIGKVTINWIERK